MPYYNWQCEVCNVSIDVERSYDEIDKSPEVGEPEDPDSLTFHKARCTWDQHKWLRIVSRGTQWIRGPSWTGRKGSW